MPTDQKLKALCDSIFFPSASNEREEAQRNGQRFVYYTTAATAMQIIKNKEIWMRSTLVMNDFLEVEHGLNCLKTTFNSEEGQKLKDALDECYDDLSNQVKNLFDAWTPGFVRDTFVTCLSKHCDEEDQFGRLSMWRAYGGTAGVALVLNSGPMFRPSDALAAYSMPVFYTDETGIKEYLSSVAEGIKENVSILKGLEFEKLKLLSFHMLRFLAVFTKHPSFSEEKEWRVVASPALQYSALLPIQTEIIGGIPQTVLKIKLEDHPEVGLTGFEPRELINKILIGPCEHPEVIRRALIQVLSEAGIENPLELIHITGVPLRPNQR